MWCSLASQFHDYNEAMTTHEELGISSSVLLNHVVKEFVPWYILEEHMNVREHLLNSIDLTNAPCVTE